MRSITLFGEIPPIRIGSLEVDLFHEDAWSTRADAYEDGRLESMQTKETRMHLSVVGPPRIWRWRHPHGSSSQ